MNAFENHIQWSAVKEVSARLREAGFQALLAGGSVRDLIMGRRPNDFDIATSATPEEVSALFPRALEVGKAFGVTILPFDGFQIEVATFREDLEYKDGRRPEGVRFSSPEADAKRRDFTVNALFYDLETAKIIDYVEGQKDIQARIIRTVGEPERRFGEDKLRLFRAVRFAAQLGFTLEPETLAAVERLAPGINVVSRERIRDELEKLLKSPGRVRGLELLRSTGLLAEAFPEVFKAVSHRGELWLKSFETLEPTATNLTTLYAAFFLPCFEQLLETKARPEAERELKTHVLKNLKLETRVIEEILFCLRHLTEFLLPETVRRGTMALLCSHQAAASAESLALALERARGVDASAIEERKGFLRDLKAVALTDAGKKPEPLLGGNDAMAAGFKPGPRMGAVLSEAYLLQLEGRFLDRDEALHWLKLQPPGLSGPRR